MVSAGIDVGQHSIKVVLLDSSEVLGQMSMVTELDSDTGARQALDEVAREAGMDGSEIGRIASTGLGRKEVSFANMRKTQETCVARGVYHVFGRECTVLDAGAGGCRAVKLGPNGKVLDFAGNAKCASGTGAFLEAACEVLRIDIERLDELASKADDVAKVSTTCAVFAESAIISNVHYGFSLESICAGVFDSVVTRLVEVLNRTGIENDLVLCGGVARCVTIRQMIEKATGRPVHVPEDPLLTTALGAALAASS